MSKKAGGKKSSKQVDEELESLKEMANKGKLRIEALERELCLLVFYSFLFSYSDLFLKVEQKEQARSAMKDKDKLQDDIAQYSEAFQEETADRHDIISNMTRQYKEMQDYLISKNKELEKKIEKLQDETGMLFCVSWIVYFGDNFAYGVAFLHVGFERTIKEKDDAIAEKERTVLELDRKMEDLAEQFRQMLQSALDKMTEKLKAGGEWEAGLLPDPEQLKRFGVEV